MRIRFTALPWLSILVSASTLPAFAHGQAAPSLTGWSGWARCEVSVRGPGYTDQQTHTWIMSGGAPAVEGAFRVYPATWSVVGGGSLQRSQGAQTLRAQWAANASMSGPLALFVRASDGRVFLQSRHAQLRARDAIQGYQQVTFEGKPAAPGKISVEAFEWTFPSIEVPRNSATAAGSITMPVYGSVGVMQPAGSQVTASCTWQFAQGAAAPAPPPAVPARPIPAPLLP
jgi:hypothetical protein